MHNHISSNEPVVCPVKIQLLLGPAPVLPNARWGHKLLFEEFAQLVKPRDIVEWIFVRECADNRCEVSWLKRLSKRLIKVCMKNEITIQWAELSATDRVQIDKLREKRSAELRSKINQLKGAADHVNAETDRLHAEANREFEREIQNIQRETYKKKFKQRAEATKREFTDADFFESWSGPYEWVSKRIVILNKEFANALEQLDQWRHGGLGERLRKAANEIIEGEYTEELNPLAVEQSEAAEVDARTDMPLSP